MGAFIHMADDRSPVLDTSSAVTHAKCAAHLCNGLEGGDLDEENPTDPFASSLRWSINVDRYTQRFLRYSDASPDIPVAALVYMERITNRKVHHLLLVSYLIAAKYHADRHFDNATYAK